MTSQTFADVRAFVLKSDRYTESYKKKLAGRLTSYARKSNRTLVAIPADLEVFEGDFGKGRPDPIPAGYKTRQQANKAASEVRSALIAYLENHVGESGDNVKPIEKDEWAIVIEVLKSCGVTKQKLIPVIALTKKCRNAGRQPHEVTCSMLMEFIRGAATAGEYKSIQDGWRLIEANADEVLRHMALPAGLPFPSLARTRNVCKRLPLPSLLSQQLEAWVRMKLAPRQWGVVQRPQQNGVKEASLKSYREALTYYYTCLVILGYLDVGEDPDLRDIVDLDLIEDIIFTELNGEFHWDRLAANSLHSNITRFLLIASDLEVDCGSIREQLTEYKDFNNIRKMSPKRKAWCRRLMSDQARIAAFYSLPSGTFKTAFDLMNNYETMTLHEQKCAIKASIAACAFAILLSLPFRIGTLLQLRHSGDLANVFAFQDKENLIVNTTAEMVKNGYAHERVSLTPKAGGNPKQIVRWFIEVVHPVLVADHVDEHLRDPSRLFAGIGYHRLYHAIVDYAVAHGIDLTPHLFRHGIATLLANEPQADYALIAALLGDTVQTVMANYAFIDQARLHVAGQDKIAASQNNALRLRAKA